MSATRWNRLVLAGVTVLPLAADARAGTAAPAGGLYTTFGNNTESTLARIDPDSGVVTVVGKVTGPDVGMVGGLAYDSLHGVLYAVASGADEPAASGWAGSLFRIDPATAAAELVGPLGAGHDGPSGLAYDAKNDVLYGGVGIAPAHLIRIDRATGAAQRVGNAIAGIAALEYLPGSDRLLYVDVPYDPPNSTLWEMNRTTGTGTLIGPTHVGGIYGTAYDYSTGTLYALPGSPTGASVAGNLYTLDPLTGAATRHVTLNRFALYNSMAYVPEPHAAWVTLAATVGCMRRRRRSE